MSDRIGDRPSRLVVVGSVNMDILVRAAALPRPGQTVIGHTLIESPGGKGANQAVAGARLGASVSLIGRVGRDRYGDHLRECLRAEGVGLDHLRVTPDCSTGVAIVCVEQSGQNAIMVIPGANDRLSCEDLRDAEKVIAQADVLLVQLEVPLETVCAAVSMARRHHVLTVLDPAPAPAVLPRELREVDLLCPNEMEAATLTGIEITDEPSATRAARRLREEGARNAIVTLGEDGALLCDEFRRCERVPCFPTAAVDTTGAGDAFSAALGITFAEQRNLRMAVRSGCAAGALAASRLGAQSAMPTWAEVAQMMETAGLVPHDVLTDGNGRQIQDRPNG